MINTPEELISVIQGNFLDLNHSSYILESLELSRESPWAVNLMLKPKQSFRESYESKTDKDKQLQGQSNRTTITIKIGQAAVRRQFNYLSDKEFHQCLLSLTRVYGDLKNLDLKSIDLSLLSDEEGDKFETFANEVFTFVSMLKIREISPSRENMAQELHNTLEFITALSNDEVASIWKDESLEKITLQALDYYSFKEKSACQKQIDEQLQNN